MRMVSNRHSDSLAVAVHHGEPGALERLVETFEPLLSRYARGMLQNAHDAQDAVQETIIRAHHSLTTQYDAARVSTLELRPWLFTTLRNLCLNRLRSRRRSSEQPLETILTVPSTGQTIDGVERRQDAERLNQALAALPSAARELVLLRFVEEMPYAEIAALLGGTEASLRGRVFRALSLLRGKLESRGVNHAL